MGNRWGKDSTSRRSGGKCWTCVGAHGNEGKQHVGWIVWGDVELIINGRELIKAEPIKDMLTSKHTAHGVSHGLSEGGYDVRIAEDVFFGEQGVCVDGEWKQGRFTLASTIEEFDMPFDLIGIVHDKSSWARQGLSVFSGTVIESGWRGWLTLELVYHGWKPLHIKAGSGIAQVLFHQLAEPAAYNGKYQDQSRGAVEAKFEHKR